MHCLWTEGDVGYKVVLKTQRQNFSFMSLHCHHTAPQLQKWLIVMGQIVHEY